MPCYEIQTTKVSLDASDRALLRDALMRLVAAGTLTDVTTHDNVFSASHGYSSVKLDFTTGALNVTAWERTDGKAARAAEIRNLIQKAYAHVVVEAACNEFGVALEAGEEADTYLTVGL